LPASIDARPAAVERAHRIERPEAGGPAPAANAIDGGVAGTEPVVTDRQFEGIDSAAVTSALGFDVTPPDPQIAVGEDHIFQMVNSLGRIYDKDGMMLESFPLIEFFSTPDGYRDADPRVHYDALTGRWFAAYMAYDDSLIGPDQGELEFAVSETSDPTGEWSVYFTPYGETFPDYPSLGITDDKVTVSYNLYDIDAPFGPAAQGCSSKDGFCGAQTVVLQKSDLLAGEDVVSTTELPVHPDRASVRAARSLSSVDDQYLASWSTNAPNRILVMRVTGTPDAGNVTEASADSLTTMPQLTPPRSKTAGGGDCIVIENGQEQNFGPPPCIDSGDGGMLDAVWRDDVLWTSATAACTPAGDSTERACAHLVAVETDGTPSVTQDIMFGAAGDYYSWPAITTDESNNLFVSLTRTRASIYAEARAAGRRAISPPNTMTGSELLRTGDVEHNSGRWGDYLGAATDPEAPGCVWLVGEYARVSTGSAWGTYIAAASYDESCGGGPAVTPTATPTPTVPTSTPTIPGPTGTPTSTLPPNVTPTRTSVPPPAACGDVNGDGAVNSIDVALILQLVAALIDDVTNDEMADVDQDGNVNSIDATLILQFDAGLIGQLSC
jgi:hypothetical protein